MESNMIMQLFLLHFIFLFLIPLSFSSYPISLPGCPDRCGNLSIPFPFGIGSDCSHGLYFNISCNTSTGSSPKAYLYYSDHIEVVEIKPFQIRLSPKGLLNSACYNKSGDHVNGLSGENRWRSSMFYASPYRFADGNRITALGCDDLVTTYASNNIGNGHDGEGKQMGSSCVTFCSNNTNDSKGLGFCPDDDSGYSKGCCAATIPRGMPMISAQLTDLSRTWRGERLYSCSYAFIQEKVTSNQSTFSFNLSDLNHPNQLFDELWNWTTRELLPVALLDWRINNAKNCSHARRNANAYACRNNSVCVDYLSSVGGYLCRCKEGYQGNPYLMNGCQDIDECSDATINPCISICTNTKGSVICSCQRGYNGDRRKDGTGCRASKLINVVTGVGAGFGFLLLVLICFVLHKALKKRKTRMSKEKFFKKNGGLLLQQRKNEGTIGKTRLFLAKELEKATDNFNKTRILGQGGQGIVYKGMLSDGIIVAIKKAKLVDKNQLEQFINEVMILSQINHRNVVQLLGCCLETEVPLLVYEFLPNGTLFDLIHDPMTEFPISWSMRLKMGADIAGALAYLHSATSTPIYHRDIKSSNILLDEKYVVKVSDFGISRVVSVDHTHLTTQVHGTFGYFDPEYFQSNQFTEKSDVYSFGVVLAELLTGQKPISSEKYDEEEKSLVTRFLSSIEDNKLDEILDPRVLEHGVKEDVKEVALLARRCLNLQGKMRPTMKEVAMALENMRLSEIPTTVAHESEETRVREAKSMMILDTDYMWTGSDFGEIPSSSETHPLKLQTV